WLVDRGWWFMVDVHGSWFIASRQPRAGWAILGSWRVRGFAPGALGAGTTGDATPTPRPRSTNHQPAAMPSVHDRFNLVSDFEVSGDQVHAFPEFVEGLNDGSCHKC